MAQLQTTSITGSLSASSNITTAGDLAVNGGDITSTAAVLNINAGGHVAVQDNFVITGTLSSSGKIITANDLFVNGGDLNSTATNFDLLASPTVVNFASSASVLYLGLNASDIRIGDHIGKNGTTLIYNDLFAASGDSTFFRSGGGSSVVTISGSGVVGSGLIIESGPGDTSFINFSSSSGFKISGADEAGITIVSGGVLEAPQGIKFDVTGEVLDDYEEGSFTPTLTGPLTITYPANGRLGTYVKVGNLVLVTIKFDVSTITGGTLSLSITGLPFTSADSAFGVSWIASCRATNLATSLITVAGSMSGGSTNINLFKRTAASTSDTNLNASDLASGSDLFVTLTYRST